MSRVDGDALDLQSQLGSTVGIYSRSGDLQSDRGPESVGDP